MIAILYAAKTKLTPTHYRVIAWRGQVTHEIWVRAVMVQGNENLEAVLLCAKPRRGETVLNAVEL